MNKPLKKNTNDLSNKFSENIDNHVHGGQLNTIAKKYNIPVKDWIDLSTGINQDGYPVTNIPDTVWNRLPENNDELHRIATQYYKCDSFLPIAGSQVAIQLIPSLFNNCTIGLVQPGYYEHSKAWQKHNHTIINFHHTTASQKNNELDLINQINKKIHLLDVLILINPNNPSGVCFSQQQLLQWHQILTKRNAYLIIDEAFMDANESATLLSSPLRSNLIILRSIGKFFGLAGIRVGFIFSNNLILDKISEFLGPWPISGPSRWIACKALADIDWQKKTRLTLQADCTRLKSLLTQHRLAPSGGTSLFQWVQTSKADAIYKALNSQGILCRLFNEPKSLRFGIPKDEIQWLKLDQALQFCNNDQHQIN